MYSSVVVSSYYLERWMDGSIIDGAGVGNGCQLAAVTQSVVLRVCDLLFSKVHRIAKITEKNRVYGTVRLNSCAAIAYSRMAPSLILSSAMMA